MNRLALLVGLDDVSDEQFVVPPVEEDEPGGVRRLVVVDEALNRLHGVEVALLVVDDWVSVHLVEQVLRRPWCGTPDHERQSTEEDQDDGQYPELPQHGVASSPNDVHGVLLLSAVTMNEVGRDVGWEVPAGMVHQEVIRQGQVRRVLPPLPHVRRAEKLLRL